MSEQNELFGEMPEKAGHNEASGKKSYKLEYPVFQDEFLNSIFKTILDVGMLTEASYQKLYQWCWNAEKELQGGNVKEIKFEIPEGTKPSICRGCGSEIFWIVTKNGKRMPVNADGTSHFSSCPDADKFRKGKNDGGTELF
jgi:hypothetical protein